MERVGGGELGGDGLWDPQVIGGGEDHSWCPVAGLEMRLGDGSSTALFLSLYI